MPHFIRQYPGGDNVYDQNVGYSLKLILMQQIELDSKPAYGRDSAPSSVVLGNLESSSSFTDNHQRESTSPPGQPLNSTMIKQQLEAIFPQASQEAIM